MKRMNVSTGRLRSAVARKRGIKLWFADHDGEVRVGIGYPGTSKTIYARGDEDDSFEELTSFDVYEEDGFSFAGYSFDPDTLYVYSDHEGRDALFEYSISNKKFGDLVYAHPEYDVAGLYFDLRRRKLVGVGVIAESPQVEILDEEAKAEFATIDRALPDTANRVYSASTDRQRMIIERSSDTHPPEYFLFTQDTKPKRLDFFLALYPDLTDAKLASMRPIRYRARDGLEIPGYLTLPVGRAPEKLPVIVYLHGGPSSRFYEAFDPVVQLFASRGFAVFQPNFRGSTGYGEAFEIAGFRQWGLSMQDDVTDGVKWLVELGIADPDRVGVYGASYGGYASLMGLIKTPQLFRAGASYAGVTDLPLLLANSEFYLFADHNRPRVGGGWGDKARLEQNSPLHRADEIRVPVLLGHGTDDPTVHVKHSARMARALERAGKSVEYMEFEDEAHGFLLESNRLAFYGRLASFFEEHLAQKPKDQSAQSLEEGVAPAHN
ncbi:MAG: S9 family peptidase [bacterium]|nr:S9 family peptidase [bacterium]